MDRRVLVVDDDPLIRSVSARTLRSAGSDVVVAGGPREALGLIGSRIFDVALVDHFLGSDQCGCTLIAPLRTHNPSIRIVIVSGLGILPDLVRHALRAGADLVTCKVQVDWLALARGEASTSPGAATSASELGAFKRAVVHGAYLVHHRNVSSTARALGITRTSLQRMLRKGPRPSGEDAE